MHLLPRLIFLDRPAVHPDSDRRKREVPLLPATRPRKKRRREDDGPSSGLPVYASAATAVADPHSSPNCHDRRGVTRGLQGLQGPFQSLALFFRHCIEKRLLESCELSAKTHFSTARRRRRPVAHGTVGWVNHSLHLAHLSLPAPLSSFRSLRIRECACPRSLWREGVSKSALLSLASMAIF